MANWYGMSRTNYFTVKNVEEFKQWVESLPDVVFIEEDGKVGFYMDSDDGSLPSCRRIVSVEDGETYTDEVEYDIFDDLYKFLAEGEVAVVMTAGHEKARYVTGRAMAVDFQNRFVAVDLDQIYEQAAQEFGVDKRKITICQY